MASLADLFNPTFFMFLGILVLVSALIVVYFESKIRDQNHKIASMLSLVSTLAEDMNGIKLGLNHLALTSFGGQNRQPFFQQPLEEENEEHEEEEGEEEEEDENNKVEKKEHKLISVSDDDDNSDSNSDSESNADDEGSLLDSVSDSESEEDEINEDEISAHNDIKVLKLNIANDLFDNNERTKDLEDLEDLEVLEDNLSDTQSVELNGELLSAEEKNDGNLLTSDFKTININLEDSNNESNNESIDYKKLSLTKLRSIVSEKGLSLDSSKLKKQDLLKLLGVE